MKKIFFISTLAASIAILGACYVFNSGFKKEKEEGNPAAPYDLFAQTRAYPDAVFDVKAFEDVMTSASSQNKNSNASSFGTWQIEGPTNIGGRITCVAVSPTNSNVILIGTPGAGIYKTTNGGATWAPVFDSKPFYTLAPLHLILIMQILCTQEQAILMFLSPCLLEMECIKVLMVEIPGQILV
ncbi:MAG: hypothetical protein IPG08_11975 [Sphingobacteriaceae bacterium]|nr:hypothetical protein [Sphingobacteriaceae bacterium]